MRLRQVPNALCWVRLGAIPVLWILALQELVVPFVVLLIAAWLTDTLDGVLCRKYGLATEFGAKLDRIADDTLTLNALAWMVVLRPELFRDYWIPIAIMLFLLGTSVVQQYARFRRKIPFHTAIDKAAAWVIGIFACYTFLWGPKPWSVAILLVFVVAALLEEIALVATREDHELDEHVLSIFAMPPRRPAATPVAGADSPSDAGTRPPS